MKSHRTHSDRVFLRSQFAIHYRRAGRVEWVHEPCADYVALFQLEGGMTCRIQDEPVELKASDALMLDPGTVAGATGRDAAYLVVTISPSMMLDCAARTRLMGTGTTISFQSPVAKQDERLTRLARDLSGEMLQEEVGHEVVIDSLMEQLIIHLLRRHANVRREEALELSRVGLVDRRIRRAIELMHANLDRELPLEEIAAAAYLSPFHFARLFKKLTGAPPHAYLATLRAKYAQQLLADPNLSISDVSARVGYSSASHFTKAFRQSTGLTPRAFRNALIQAR